MSEFELGPALLVVLTGVGVVGASLWFADRQRYVFLLSLTTAGPEVRRGKVTPGFLEEVRTVCREHNLQSGWVGGVRQGQRIRLVFARALPPNAQQRLRNIWGVVGWGGKKLPA